MLFQEVLTIPANTTEKAPETRVVEISPGVAVRVLVGFPLGCKGLVHVAIWHQHWQVWPWTPGQYFEWDGYVFDFPAQYSINEPPFELTIKGWSEDDSYEHEIFFGVVIEPERQSIEGLSADEIYLELESIPG